MAVASEAVHDTVMHINRAKLAGGSQPMVVNEKHKASMCVAQIQCFAPSSLPHPNIPPALLPAAPPSIGT